MESRADGNPEETPENTPATITDQVVESVKEVIEKVFLDGGVMMENSQQICNTSFEGLEGKEKEVMEKVIIASEKINSLRHCARQFLPDLAVTIESTLVAFRCGVDDQTVFGKFERDLDVKIMTGKLDELCEKTQETESALATVQIYINSLTSWCKGQITKLPAEESSKISKKCWEIPEQFGRILTLVQSMGNVHPSIKYGTVAIGLLTSVTLTALDVKEIRKMFKNVIQYLQSSTEYWKRFQEEIKGLQKKLVELSKCWMSLKKNTNLSSNYCSYFLGESVENSDVRGNLKEEFLDTVTAIKDKCNEASESNLLNGSGLSASNTLSSSLAVRHLQIERVHLPKCCFE